MKKLFLLLLLVMPKAFGQTVEILEYHELAEKPPYVSFTYLQPATDISQARFIAKVKSTGSLKKPTLLYQFIKAEAQKMGANSFRVNSFKKLGDGVNGELIVSLYRVDNDILDINTANTEKGKIYVFGEENMLSDKKQGYKIDGDKFEIQSGAYSVYELPIGKEIKITKGGFTGSSLWFLGSENKPNIYISFGGFGVTGAQQYYGYNPGGGISFTTGKINEVNEDVAWALMHILKKH